MSFVGCFPFWLSGEIPSFIDAFYETVSGFTTTGSTILTDVEALSHGMLMWRSFLHWLGGMGVIVFLLAIIPKLGGQQNIFLMKAESPGPIVGKAVLRGENPDIAEADLRLVQAGRYAKTWQEGSKKPHKKCMRCGFETDEDYNYCPVCGGRI